MTDRRELALDALLGASSPTSARPATNAPTIGASLRRVGELGERQRERERDGHERARRAGVAIEELEEAAVRSSSPTNAVTTRNPIATSTITATSATDTEPSDTRRTTTVRITSPSTSSATAAPSTVRASTVASARRSLNTRAVMPTLVAASAAPMNSDWFPP